MELKKTKKELLSSLDSKELTEWMAYFELTPRGEDREDIRNAMQCTLIHNANFQKEAKLEDFIIKEKRPTQQQSEELILEIWKAFCA